MVEVGSTIGNYEVLQKIGQGAMGSVFLARHPSIGKRVALKVIHPELLSDEEMVARFFNEARAVTQIGHPHIVEVQDFGQTPDGESFIVMELLEGVGLGELIRREGPLPIDRAVRIARQLTEGLKAAHTRGIIHRDLKPDNIVLVPRGSEPDFVKILDFGLAKLTGPGAMTHKTRTGTVLGTAHYMAPESAEDSRKIDHRIDVYALGCILFEMVIGRVPFPGEGFGEVLVRQLREPPPLPSRLRADVPAWLEKIILHALAKKPDFRFPTMDDFGQALRDPVAWEKRFDDHELAEDELARRRAADMSSSVQPIGPQRSGPVAQIASDAKTMSADAGAVLSGARPAPPARLPGEEREDAPEEAEADDEPVRRRPASRGVLGSVLGALVILGVGFGVARHLLYADVQLSIVTTPPGATITIGASSVGTSPSQIRLPRSKTPVVVSLQKPGYVSAQRSIEPSQNHTLDVSLAPEPPPPAPVAPPTSPPPAPRPVVKIDPNDAPSAAPSPPLPSANKEASEAVPKRTARPKAKKAEPALQHDGILLRPSF